MKRAESVKEREKNKKEKGRKVQKDKSNKMQNKGERTYLKS